MLNRSYFFKVVLVIVTLGLLVFLGAAALVRPWRERLLEGFSYMLRGAGQLSWHADATSLEHQRIQLLAEIASREEFKRENELLRQALTLKNEGALRVTPATVVGFLHEGRDEYLLLNRGIDDGIAAGDVVVSRDQIFVGTIADITPRTAHVSLVTSASRSTDVSLAGTTLRAIARGNNDRELIIDLVPQQSDLKVGDLLVASSRVTGLTLPLLIAEVREVKQAENEVFKFVRAVHLFDPADDEVIILRP